MIPRLLGPLLLAVVPAGAQTIEVAPSAPVRLPAGLSVPAAVLTGQDAFVTTLTALPAPSGLSPQTSPVVSASGISAQALVPTASALAAAKPTALAGRPTLLVAGKPAAAAAASKPAAPSALSSVARAAAKAAPDSSSSPEEAAAVGAEFDGAEGRARPEAVPAFSALSAAHPLPAASTPEERVTPGVPAAKAPAPAKSRRRFVWPALVATVWSSWTVLMTAFHHWGLFASDWFMTVTMAFGSFIAGATSEGSGSVSFPVMTLLFHIPPPVARDFALMIQSVGMTTAALTILATGIPIERRVLLLGIAGGAVGMVLGSTFIAPLFVPAFAKMFFTSLWAAFAVSHWLAGRRRDRAAVESLGPLSKSEAALMLGFAVAGGVVSSIVGTGLCMVMFTLLTLGFRLSEKVATPTSVVLMATNALVGFFWKSAFLGGMAAAAWGYWWVSVPIVVIGAPLGARFIAGRSRTFITRLLYGAIAAQLVAALLIVHQTPLLFGTSLLTFAVGSLVFRALARRGDRAAGASR